MEKKAVDFCMTVHLFGTVSSSACANYALRRTADLMTTKMSMESRQPTPLEGILCRRCSSIGEH